MAVITSIDLTPGGTPIHVTVLDQDGAPLPPAEITWALPTGVTTAADDTGFNFSADTTAATGDATATYSGPRAPAPVTGPALVVNVAPVVVPVTALQYASP